MLQSKAGYIDARPFTASSTKSACNARPDHTLGHSHRLGRLLITSGLPRTTDIPRSQFMKRRTAECMQM
jgi:hypothetical protein